MTNIPLGNPANIDPRHPVVVVPQLCEMHLKELLVNRLQIPETGPWQRAIATCLLVLGRTAIGHPSIVRRSGGRPEDLTLILAEIGCLACKWPALFDAADLLLRKGLRYAERVVYGELTDTDWNIAQENTWKLP